MNCVCYDSGRCLNPSDSKFLEGNHGIGVARSGTVSWGLWRSAEERIFKKANQELTVLKKMEEKDQSDTRWHHFPKISFFFYKRYEHVLFLKEKNNHSHFKEQLQNGKGFESKQS